MSRTKGQFFSIDVFVAVAIVSVGLFVLFSSKPYQPLSTQAFTLSTDLIGSLNSITITALDNDYVYELRAKGNISNPSNTLLSQIGEFYWYGQLGIARNLTANVTENVIPFQYGFSLYLNNTLVYESRPYDNSSATLVSTKRMITGFKNSTEFWGPLKTEVWIWR